MYFFCCETSSHLGEEKAQAVTQPHDGGAGLVCVRQRNTKKLDFYQFHSAHVPLQNVACDNRHGGTVLVVIWPTVINVACTAGNTIYQR